MNRKNESKKWIISITLVLIFSFFVGYYFCYRVNEKSKTKSDIIREIMENEWYYGKEDPDFQSTLETKMILGMIDMDKDPFTRYLTSLGTLADSFIGIGIGVNIYGEYFIVDEVNSIHAKEDGIRVGDILTKVNDVDVKNMTLDQLNSTISACEGNVALTFIRNDQSIIINTVIQEYDPLTIFTREYDNVSYVQITEFNMDTSEHLEAYFKTLSNNYNNLILDLRGNPGGYIVAVRDVLDLFVGSGKVVMTTIDKNGNSSIIKTSDSSFYVFDKITVMIDENSASGAEALAAAINYHLDDVVTLYGDVTYGKGSAQTTYTFNDGTYFHYTYALWYTPEGKTINKIGVVPEVYDINEGISSLGFVTEESCLYDYGDKVKGVQKLLKSLGYDLVVHSFFDEETKSQIEKYQQDYNLEVTGKVDTATLRHMIKLIYDDKQIHLNNQLEEVLGSLR